MRKVRHLAAGLVAGALLMLGGQALADIPDPHPSAPDAEHTFYVCVAPAGGAVKAVYALDKTLGNCPANYTEVRLVPSALP